MSADNSATDEADRRTTYGGPVLAILTTFGTIGAVLTVVSAEGIEGPNVGLFWGSARLGFAVSLLYLLTKIANGVHRSHVD